MSELSKKSEVPRFLSVLRKVYRQRANKGLAKEIRDVINKHSRENKSNTPDFILANFMIKCLEAGEKLIGDRDEWYNISPNPKG